MTATMPGEQGALTLRATTPSEFRALLGKVREAAQLSGGQIAAKTGMPRSTAYSLYNTNRPGLPSNPDQVRSFVQACGLSNTQVDVVMDLWNTLHNEQEDRKVAEPTDDVLNLLTRPQFLTWSRHLDSRHPDSDLGDLDDVHEKFSNMSKLLMACSDFSAPQQQKTTLFDLVHYVLGRDDRARRAVRLLQMIALIVSVVVAGLVILAIVIPTTAPFVVTGLVASLLSPLVLTARELKPSRRRKPPHHKLPPYS